METMIESISLKRQKTYDVVPEHFLSVRGLSMPFLDLLLRTADEMKDIVARQGGDERLKRRVLAAAFYEPSTRTSSSFQAAMLRLGGSIININEEQSSVKKGESLEDTLQTLDCYCDVIVIRHPVQGSAHKAAAVSSKPVINAGDGTGEHPTQALLDLYTIRSELGRISGTDAEHPMIVTLVGDLKNGRTVHSLALLLCMFEHIKLVYIAPAGLEIPSYLVEEIDRMGCTLQQVHGQSLEEAIKVTDVLYVTRIQKERFQDPAEYERVLGSYCVDTKLMMLAKQQMTVMHPLPRLMEIHPDVDFDPRAAYFRQMENGMYVRMALLSLMLIR